MNYWERHIGDYARDAGHLTMLEHGAYTVLLDRYYSTEQPIPEDQAHRVCRARSKEERAAVDAVLNEFFTLKDGQWVNGRADRELVKAQAKIEAARTNGAKGGRPKGKAEGTEQKPTGLPLGSVSDTQQKAHQTPDSTEDISKATPSHPPAFADGQSDQPTAGTIPCPYQAIVDAYHLALPGLPTVKLMPVKRQAAMRKLWGWILSSKKADGTRRAQSRDEALAWVAGYFGHAANNDFLMGRSGRTTEHAGWQCDIDFLLSERGMKIVIEKTQVAA